MTGSARVSGSTGAMLTNRAGWGDTEIHWREAGAGPTVVLLHCFPVDGRLFAAQLRAAASGRLRARLVVPDFPGFGQSPPPSALPERYTVAELALLVGELLDFADARDPILAGVAIGGTVALELASMRRDVAGLIVISTKPARDDPRLAAKREILARRVTGMLPSALTAKLARAPLSPTVGEDALRAVELMVAAANRYSVAALVRAIASRPDPMRLLHRLSMPALVIAGEDDPYSPPHLVWPLADGLPQATFIRIPRAGHMAPVERPRVFTRILGQFVKSLAAAPRDPTRRSET